MEIEEKIEKAIYERGSVDPGFAIAYALIQCAAALHGIEANLAQLDVVVRDLTRKDFDE